jgi:hypothetical protein
MMTMSISCIEYSQEDLLKKMPRAYFFIWARLGKRLHKVKEFRIGVSFI